MASEKVCGNCKRVFKEEKDFLAATSQWRVCTAQHLWFNCTCGSTLMIPKGKFPWYSPTLGMDERSASLFSRMATLQELPHIPSAIIELQQMLVNPEIETSALAKAVKRDPFLAGEVLGMADSLRRLREAAVKDKDAENIEYAISFIGRRQLSNLVTAAALKKFVLKTSLFDHEAFWEHAFLAAKIAEVIAQRFLPNQTDQRDKAYLASSLCNVGKIVAAICFPEATDSIQEIVNDPKRQTTWSRCEQELGLYEHTILGEIGGAFWGFPNFVIEGIKYHHAPPAAHPSEVRDEQLCHLVCLANMLAHWINLEPHRIDHERMAAEAAYFHLSRSELEKLVEHTTKLVVQI